MYLLYCTGQRLQRQRNRGAMQPGVGERCTSYTNPHHYEASPLSRAVGTGGVGGQLPPTRFCQIKLPYSNQGGRLFPQNFYLPHPPDFQTFLRPSSVFIRSRFSPSTAQPLSQQQLVCKLLELLFFFQSQSKVI